MTHDARSLVTCSFCGKTQREVRKVVAGPDVHICDECIGLCNAIIDGETASQPAGGSSKPACVYAFNREAAKLAVTAHRLADSCDRAVELPRPVAERARALAEEVELFASANAGSRTVLLEFAHGLAAMAHHFARACDALELPGHVAQRARTLADEI